MCRNIFVGDSDIYRKTQQDLQAYTKAGIEFTKTMADFEKAAIELTNETKEYRNQSIQFTLDEARELLRCIDNEDGHATTMIEERIKIVEGENK